MTRKGKIIVERLRGGGCLLAPSSYELGAEQGPRGSHKHMKLNPRPGSVRNHKKKGKYPSPNFKISPRIISYNAK